MSFNIDNKTLDIPCPKCSNKIPETIGNIKRNVTITCSRCGTNIKLEADKFKKGIEELEASIDRLKRSFKKLN